MPIWMNAAVVAVMAVAVVLVWVEVQSHRAGPHARPGKDA